MVLLGSATSLARLSLERALRWRTTLLLEDILPPIYVGGVRNFRGAPPRRSGRLLDGARPPGVPHCRASCCTRARGESAQCAEAAADGCPVARPARFLPMQGARHHRSPSRAPGPEAPRHHRWRRGQLPARCCPHPPRRRRGRGGRRGRPRNPGSYCSCCWRRCPRRYCPRSRRKGSACCPDPWSSSSRPPTPPCLATWSRRKRLNAIAPASLSLPSAP